ncbi:Zn-ribbon domain-containing OB-fold protein [Aquicoccus porphyridii]|uniref:Zn-ribbon domain-containing OB-fold protein n=1 Tax=Aquicoccus porphyridii TaxID=1852029 RepID=A0A5A9YYQ8_9RHOB|nr:Zn-ribbon domain-containing OB-fold protein [Aquicoccus porphyridii]KAA0910026.1 Zn-ribbon domain-containing OB-fold protein [Aquicoccus porphyridii]RAI52107.1 DNA-binding protein [Rhodobacteraceae bacterium AsT-22]
MNQRQIPTIHPETRFYWDGARQGRLLLNSCPACDKAYFPPRPFCPTCGSRDVTVIEASGKGRLYSYVISHLPAPGYEPPFTVAVVQLEEGVKMVTNIVDCPAEPELLVLDMALEVTFESRGDVTVPQFRPAGGGT